MKKLNIVITLEVQDGENRYKLHSPKTIEIEIGKDQKEQINDFGEELAKEYFSGTSSEAYSVDWYEIDGGIRAIRYSSFEIIENNEAFELIERILYK